MNIKAKVAIFLVAVLLALFQFNAITCCCCCGDILKIGKRAGYEIIANVLAREAKTVETF